MQNISSSGDGGPRWDDVGIVPYGYTHQPSEGAATSSPHIRKPSARA
ncbi:MAG: hypothetical protein IJC52_03900 [Clostridia bacterium]|nr:hypothetical protein [Clostridia bacterium]